MESSTNLFELEQNWIEVENTGVNATRIFEEIHKEIGDYLTGQVNDADSTDGVIDFLENLTSRLHQDFDELIGEDTNKKRFVKALTRIFALLLNTKVDTADKIKRILRISIESTMTIWQEPKWLLVEWSTRSRRRRYVKTEGARGSGKPTPTRLNWACLNRRQSTSQKMEKSSRPYVSDVNLPISMTETLEYFN